MKKSHFFKGLQVFVVVVFLSLNLHVRAQDFVHPGIFNTEADYARMREKIAEKAEPWYTAWQNLLASPEAQLSWVPYPLETIIRGGTGDNVSRLYTNVAAAYQDALIYKISGDKAHGDKAVEILNAWSSVQKYVSGNADRYLAAGLDGYKFAAAAEMMRGYPGFDLARFKKYMLDVYYYPMNERFILGNAWGAPHNDAVPTNYRVNWDACNMDAMLAISILCDNKENFDKTINYAKTGDGNGNIHRAVNYVHSDLWGQWEESGRDQGHAVGGLMLYGLFCQMAWNQGSDMFAYDDYRYRKGAEYVARYNVMTTDASGNSIGKYNDLPFTSYTFQQGPLYGPYWTTESVLSSATRGKFGSVWGLIYSHYANVLDQPDKVQSVKEKMLQDRWRSTGVPSASIHPDTYDQPGVGALTFYTDSGSSVYPWSHMDISVRSIAKLPHYGKTTMKDSILTVTGSGQGIGGTADYCQFAYQSLLDDCSIVAKIDSVNETTSSCQAGLMIRGSLDQNAENVFLSVNPSKGAVLSCRDSLGKVTDTLVVNASINSFPCWARINRTNNTFTAAISSDSITWTEIGAKTFGMARRAYIGVAVSSDDRDTVATAVFSNVSLEQGNIKPIIKLSGPTNGASNYIAPADVIVKGSAYDPDGTLDSVKIYLNDSLVCRTDTSTLDYTISGLPKGTYKIYADAYDNLGAKASTDTISVTVNNQTNRLPYYKFDETNSIICHDANGNYLVGLTYNGPTFSPGKIGNAINLDGTDQYVKLRNGVIDSLSNFTISMWVYQTTASQWSRIFDFGSGTDSYMFLTPRNASGVLSFVISSPQGTIEVPTNRIFPIRGWHHVAVTLASDTLNIYMDGYLVGSNNSFNLRPYDIAPTTANYLGKSQYSSDPYFNGSFDDMRFYNYALSQDEVKNLMAYTSVNNIRINTQLFYPNPASSSIRMNNISTSKIDIYNVTGALVLEKQVNTANAVINVQSLQSGVYFLKSVNQETHFSEQNVLIVKK